MIQLPTSPTNRAATAFRPWWYLTAMTVARASSEPSELTKRTPSSNSSGSEEANSTSCSVPNSIVVCSCSGLRAVESVITRTAIRTGEALGKSCASFSTQVCDRPVAATTVASLNKKPVLCLSRPNRCLSERRLRFSKFAQTQVHARRMVCTGATKGCGCLKLISASLCGVCGYGVGGEVLRLSQGDTRASHGCPGEPIPEQMPSLCRGLRCQFHVVFLSRTQRNIVELQLAIKRRSADAQHFSGERLVASRLFEHAENRHSL